MLAPTPPITTGIASGRKSRGRSSSRARLAAAIAREQRPDRAMPMSASATAAIELPATAGEEERERRQRDELREHEEREHADRLAEPDRAPVAGREHEAVEEPLLALGANARVRPSSAVKTIAIQSSPSRRAPTSRSGSAKWKIVSAETTKSSIAASVSRARSSSSSPCARARDVIGEQ
jgi:hypothetical protein